MAQKKKLIIPEKVNSRFSKALFKVLESSFIVARKLKSEYVTPRHVFTAMLLRKESLSYFLLTKLGMDSAQTIKRITGLESTEFVQKTRPTSATIELHPATQTLLFEAVKIARASGGYYVGTEHFLLALFQGDSKDISFVKELLSHIPSFPNFASEVLKSVVLPFDVLRQAEDVSLPMNKPLPHLQQEAGGESALSVLTEHMTNKHRKFDPIISKYQRKNITDQILTILMRSRNRNIMLIGPSGVGKSHVIDELSYRFVNRDVPLSISQNQILRLNLPAIFSLAKFPNEVEKHVMAVLNDIYGSDEIVLYIDDVATLINSPIRGGLNMGATLKAFLERNNMNIVVSLTNEEYAQIQIHNKALLRFFSIIEIDEPSGENAKQLMKDAVKQIEREHNITIQSDALESVIHLSDQYIPDRVLPEKAIEVLDLAASKKKFAREYKYRGVGELQKLKQELQERKDNLVLLGDYLEAEKIQDELNSTVQKIKDLKKQHKKSLKNDKLEITSEDVKEVISMWTDLPMSTVSADETSMLLKLDKKIKEQIISQEDAIGKVASAVKRGRVGISSKKRPWTSLLFLGPTGVGKTELAKVLGTSLFGKDDDRLIQIDMSEYMEQHSISKLIGSPPGYVGFEQGGLLTEKIAENPYSVVLFDEIEKAHPDVLNILLQILEDGHLTDSKGTKVSFQNTIIILTSNIGAEEIAEDKVLGFYREKKQRDLVELSSEAYEEMKEKLLKELRKKLRPELLNRLDDVIIFKALTKDDASKVLEILLEDLNDRLKDLGIILGLTNKAKLYVVDKGFSTEYGARPLRRVLQHEIESLIADYVLENNLLEQKSGTEIALEIDVKRKKLVIL